MEVLNARPNAAIWALAARLLDNPSRLRWGGPKVPNAINGEVSLLNGLQQLQAFQREGVPTIAFTTNPAIRDGWQADGWTVLGRNLNHTQGRDIVVPGYPITRIGEDGHPYPGRPLTAIRANLRWNKRDFWTQYRGDVANEWRIHIMRDSPGGELLRIARGLKTSCLHTNIEDGTCANCGLAPNHPPAGQPGIIIRSRRLGWVLRHDVAPPEPVVVAAKAAVVACGYDMAAVDVLELVRGGKVMVLECNSRPALRDPYTLGQYASFIRRHYPGAEGA